MAQRAHVERDPHRRPEAKRVEARAEAPIVRGFTGRDFGRHCSRRDDEDDSCSRSNRVQESPAHSGTTGPLPCSRDRPTTRPFERATTGLGSGRGWSSLDSETVKDRLGTPPQDDVTVRPDHVSLGYSPVIRDGGYERAGARCQSVTPSLGHVGDARPSGSTENRRARSRSRTGAPVVEKQGAPTGGRCVPRVSGQATRRRIG